MKQLLVKKSTPKIAFITTVNHNVGDDFVRDGILYLLTQLFGPLEHSLINKHLPCSARPEFDWISGPKIGPLVESIPGLGRGRASRLIERLPLNRKTDKILTADCLVQSGAPLFWVNQDSDSSLNEWSRALIDRRWKETQPTIPLLNLGVGSCQHYHSDGTEFLANPRVCKFIESFVQKCLVTTVRDTLSVSVLRSLGLEASLIPCPSVFARKANSIQPRDQGYVVLNFMKRGGHFSLGGENEGQNWEKTFTSFAKKLARRIKCILVCHTKGEVQLAQALLPGIDVFFSDNYVDYLQFFSGAHFGVVNRVHAGFALGSFGVPALVIGNDSRSRMTELLGLPNLYVEDATEDRLWEHVDSFETNRPRIFRRLMETCGRAEADYLKLLGGKKILSSGKIEDEVA